MYPHKAIIVPLDAIRSNFQQSAQLGLFKHIVCQKWRNEAVSKGAMCQNFIYICIENQCSFSFCKEGLKQYLCRPK